MVWVSILPHIPKSSRYTLGTRIENELPRSRADGVSYGKFFCEPFILASRCEVFWFKNKFIDLLETSYTAYFIEKDRKVEKISVCIFTFDILKFLISLAWENKMISHKQYETIALKLDEIGKMMWGWKKSIEQPKKKNPT